MNLTPGVKKLIACLCLFSGMTLFASAQKIIPVDSSKLQTLRIDPSNATGGNASDFFTEVNYIPLETTNESTFGSIARMEITEDYFIILDWTTYSVLIFNKNGKFHAKIKGTQNAPIWGFRLNRFTKEIMYSKDNYKTYTFCNYDGKTIRTMKTGGDLAKDEVNDGDAHYFSADKAVTNFYPNTIDSTDKNYKTYSKSLIVYSDGKNKVYAQGLPFDKREAGHLSISTGVGPLSSFGVDTAFFYCWPYRYRVYTITPHTIQYTYKLIFPMQSSLPNDYPINEEIKKNDFQYIQNHPNQIFAINNFYRVNDNLLFKTGIWGSNDEDNLIYNLKSGTLIAYKHILQDERSYFLPIYDNTNGGSSFSKSGLLACYDGYIYTSASSLGMFQYHEKYADKKAAYPPALAEYFKKRSKRDNPVIIQLKLKDQL